MEIKARRWLAIWYRCPKCGAQTGSPMLTPTKRHREYVPACYHYRCDCRMEIVERKYYTTFAIEAGVSFTTIAGTLEKIGPFKVCNIVFPNIRAFREWVEMRQAELAEQSRKYMEEFRKRQEESEARHERERQEKALLKEAEQVAYRRNHAVELAAEQIAREFWPKESEETDRLNLDGVFDLYDDDHPF
jgi:hypothetical protein